MANINEFGYWVSINYLLANHLQKIMIPYLWKNRKKKKLSKKLEHLLTKILKTKALNIIFIYKGIKKVLSQKKKRGIKKVNLFHNYWNPLKLT